MIRLVKMTFRPEETARFEALFETVKDRIRNFPGCMHVELLKDLNEPNVYFTRSEWDSEKSLEKYRKSELFAATWTDTKALFLRQAEAWSTDVKASGKVHN